MRSSLPLWYACVRRRDAGPKLGLRIQNMVAMVTGLLIGFVTAWRLALVIIGTVPIMALSGMMMMKMMTCTSRCMLWSTSCRPHRHADCGVAVSVTGYTRVSCCVCCRWLRTHRNADCGAAVSASVLVCVLSLASHCWLCCC